MPQEWIIFAPGMNAFHSIHKCICTFSKRFGEIDSGCQFHQHAYVQVLQAQIPKVQKDRQVISVFLRF